jgi:hypothetical protein
MYRVFVANVNNYVLVSFSVLTLNSFLDTYIMEIIICLYGARLDHHMFLVVTVSLSHFVVNNEG